MANLVESVRTKILLGRFLSQDELTQEQYELLRSPECSVKDVLKLHDTLFGGNLSKTIRNKDDSGPFTPPDIVLDVIDEKDFLDSPDMSAAEPSLV